MENRPLAEWEKELLYGPRADADRRFVITLTTHGLTTKSDPLSAIQLAQQVVTLSTNRVSFSVREV